MNEETFERLAKAFMRHKEQSEKRFRKLESLLKEKNHIEPNQIEAPKETIEIEDQEEKTKEEADNGNLNNMLRE
ncbi:MAG: hypothetical protein U5J95_10440 [Balneolaceae bacterium]|nr:hypothetical protein [Balneolaceae bacterium]